MKTIRIDEDVHRDLLRLKGQMITESGESATFSDVIRRLIKIAKEECK